MCYFIIEAESKSGSGSTELELKGLEIKDIGRVSQGGFRKLEGNYQGVVLLISLIILYFLTAEHICKAYIFHFMCHLPLKCHLVNIRKKLY